MNDDRPSIHSIAGSRQPLAARAALRLGLLTLGSCLLLALPASAQDPAPPAPAEPPKIDVTVFVDVYYDYNFNEVDPALRSFDVQHDAFSLRGGSSWWGIAAYAKVETSPTWALVGRYEYLDDTDGGFMTIGQKAQTVTLTSDHLVAGGLKLRLEYRGEFTEEPFFVDDTGEKKDSQHAVLAGVVFTFGGRI